MAALSFHIVKVGFVAVCFCLRYVQSEPFQARSYNIDLDLPPEQRWVKVMEKYAEYTPQIVASLRSKLPAIAVPLAEKLALYLDDHFPEPFPGEMRGVSKGLNLSLADTVLLNIFYDLTAFCTSIVAQDKDGNIFHGRNLDYGFTKILRNITFISNFQSKGKFFSCLVYVPDPYNNKITPSNNPQPTPPRHPHYHPCYC